MDGENWWQRLVWQGMNLHISDLAGAASGVKPVTTVFMDSARLGDFERLASHFSLKTRVLGQHHMQPPDSGVRLDIAVSRRSGDLREAEVLERTRVDRESEAWYALWGYPRCCSEFFRTRWFCDTQRDRGRDLIRRIHANTARRSALPFELNTVFQFGSRFIGLPEARRRKIKEIILSEFHGLPLAHLHVISWHPCRHDCERSRKSGRRLWKWIHGAWPEIASEMRAVLARPVLYLEAERFAVLKGVRPAPPSYRYAGIAGTYSRLPKRERGRLEAGDELRLAKGGVEILGKKKRLGMIRGREPLLLSFSAKAAPKKRRR